MLSRRIEFSRRAVRWLLPAAALALTPKCLLCVLAYAGLGAALGLGGPEICGAPTGDAGSWTTWLSALGLAALAIGIFRAPSAGAREQSRASGCKASSRRTCDSGMDPAAELTTAGK